MTRPQAAKPTAVLEWLCAALMLSTPALAGPLEDAEAAHNRGDHATVRSLVRPAAERGDAAAQYLLGSSFLTVEVLDEVEAAKWFLKAALQGHAAAQNALGFRYELGRGVLQDYAEAAKWYRKSADQAHPVGQYNTGRTYMLGRGVKTDYVQAHMWFNLATANSPNTASRNSMAQQRDDLAKMMNAAQIAEAQRLAREWRPARP